MKSFIPILVFVFVLPGLSLPLQAEPQPVYTSVYLMNLYDLNINEYSYYADFYVWFHWKGELDPMNIEFVNSLEKWGFTVEPFFEEHKVLPDDWLYNGMRIEGRFYHPFELGPFPLDKHALSIQLEHVDYPSDSLVYVPDTSSSLLRAGFILPGWEIYKTSMESHTHLYETNFGETGSGKADFSNFSFYIHLKRPLSYFTLKLMLPLLVVILACLGALFIYPTYLDARVSLPIGGLLSCVFLQQSYSSALPDVGYMVLMDKIYLLSYLLIALIMLNVMISGNRMARDPDRNIPRIYRGNKWLAGGLLVAYLLGVVLLI
ncbi:MAG TPA: hypothetical protein PKA00_09410 [Saprospiraceae bacterium]|nr:hypothetical protein [Saprospiraceae bacterium]HMQ83115.1 hypothetical protein [Saprospiraceae bacterium]